MKEEKGITLIALVITIIVLIILAGISISLVLGDNGIVTKAKQAKEQTEQAKSNEESSLNEAVKYVEDLGTSNDGSSTPNPTPTPTINDLKAGEYIKYNTGVSSVGENGVIICRVLYEASSEYGLQIISDKKVADVTLGGSDWASGRNSYNNAITTLNSEAAKYLNTAYVTDARCVGSVPTNQNGTFTNKNSENVGPVKLQFNSSISGASNMKQQDNNYVTDKTQMESLGILTIEEKYWVASRSIYSVSTGCNFYVKSIDTNGFANSHLCHVDLSGDAYAGLHTNGLRPCFALKSDIKITGGNGTSDTPYTM